MRFPVDLGNGPVDQCFFQLDDEAPRYFAARQELIDAGLAPARHGLIASSESERRAHEHVLAWIDATLEREHPGLLERSPSRPTLSDYDARLALLQEDAVVLQRDTEGRDRTIMVSVWFPSGWRPERIFGTSFAQIHVPVPDFVDDERAAASMVGAMVERGPYVRFVWTVAADDYLDHHPEQGRRIPWAETQTGFVRVERQLTIPFPQQQSSLFLIRTYLYPFATLAPRERGVLEQAVMLMPEPIRRYKGLLGNEAAILERLRASGPIEPPSE